MSLIGVYDDQNIFARIVRAELPSARIFEDDETLAFMDAFPQARGHCLVVSKTSRARNLLEIEPEALCAVMTTVQKLVRAVNAALKPDGIIVTQFNGAPAGQTVFHLHVHILPRWEGQALGRHAGGSMADAEELAGLASQIGVHLES